MSENNIFLNDIKMLKKKEINFKDTNNNKNSVLCVSIGYYGRMSVVL